MFAAVARRRVAFAAASGVAAAAALANASVSADNNDVKDMLGRLERKVDALGGGASDVPKEIKVLYFGIPATPGEKLRIALSMAIGVDNFDDSRIAFKDWGAMKSSLKYNQLPVLYLDGKDFHQSGAALRYIGAHLGDGSLYPIADPAALLKIEEMIGVLDDLQRAWTPNLYVGMRPAYLGIDFNDGSWTDESKQARIKAMRTTFVDAQLPRYMGYIENALEASGGKFLAGSTVSIADCQALPQLDYFTRGVADYMPRDTLDKYPAVKAYLARMKEVPQIKAWYAKSK